MIPCFSVRFFPALAAGILAFAAARSHAQVSVAISAPKTEVIPYEPAVVTVEISNRSARPILLATPGDDGSSWIKFIVTNDRGELVPLTGEVAPMNPFQIRPGQAIQQRVVVSNLFPMTEFGGYSVQASVYIPPDQAYAPSNRLRFNVVGAREIWSDAFGVPVGNPDGGGTSRIFRLLQLRSLDKLYLYARLDDRATGTVLACMPIGTTLELRPPSYTIDGEGNLHVLHQVTPDISYHVVVNSSGKMVRRDAHMETKGSRPTLAAAADNSIGVIGGRLYDPDVERLRKLTVRRVSERPTGLAEILGREPAPPPTAPGEDPNYQPLTPPPTR